MLRAPMNNLIVKVKTKYISNISDIMRISSIENGSSVDSVDLVNIVGTVVSKPLTITKDSNHLGFSDDLIKVDDTIIFSYNIIHDFVLNSADESAVYKNRFFHEGEEYFLADINKIYGIIREDNIIMLNGFVMTGPVQESVIIIPKEMKKIKAASETYAMHYNYSKIGDKQIDIQSDDTVYFSTFSAQKYQINGKKFCILPQNKIFGKKLQD